MGYQNVKSLTIYLVVSTQYTNVTCQIGKLFDDQRVYGSYDTTIKSSPKWPIMCRVGR